MDATYCLTYNITGADLKSWASDPTVNTQEDYPFIRDIFGITSGDVQCLGFRVRQVTDSDVSMILYLGDPTINPESWYIQSGAPPYSVVNIDPMNVKALNGSIPGRIQVLDGVIDDINDTLELELIFFAAVPGGWPTSVGPDISSLASTSSVSAAISSAVPARSFSSASRSLDSAFQISTTRDAAVSYSVDISCSMSLTSGQQGTTYLEYADDSGFTTSVVEVSRFVNGNAGALTVGLSLIQNNTGTVSGLIPTGKYARIRTQNNTGTPTFTYRSGQEVLL